MQALSSFSRVSVPAGQVERWRDTTAQPVHELLDLLQTLLVVKRLISVVNRGILVPLGVIDQDDLHRDSPAFVVVTSRGHYAVFHFSSEEQNPQGPRPPSSALVIDSQVAGYED